MGCLPFYTRNGSRLITMEGLFYLRPQSSVLIYVVLTRREQKNPRLKFGRGRRRGFEIAGWLNFDFCSHELGEFAAYCSVARPSW